MIEFGLVVLEKKNFSVLLLFCYYFSLEKGIPLHLNKLESPFPRMVARVVQWLKRRLKDLVIFASPVRIPLWDHVGVGPLGETI